MRETFSFSGAFRRGDPDLPFRYFQFDMPAGATRLDVSYHFLRDDAVQPEWGADDVVDIGMFDTRGTDMQGGGFRGWQSTSSRVAITPRNRRVRADSAIGSRRARGISGHPSRLRIALNWSIAGSAATLDAT